MAESLPFLSEGNSFVGSVAHVQQAGLTSSQSVYLENLLLGEGYIWKEMSAAMLRLILWSFGAKWP